MHPINLPRLLLSFLKSIIFSLQKKGERNEKQQRGNENTTKNPPPIGLWRRETFISSGLNVKLVHEGLRVHYPLHNNTVQK